MTDNHMKIHPDDWRQLLGDIEQLRKERDEARREVSELKANEANRLSSAVRLKGWICFEEETP